MKINALFGIVVLIIGLAQSLVAQTNPVTIGLIGDSTVAERKGWGPAFADRCNGQLKVINVARPGSYLKVMTKRLADLLKQDPDYVFIEFGHNDMDHYGVEEYSEHLRTYVDKIKASGSIPVIFSSITRRNFDESGKIVSDVLEGNRSLPIFGRAAEAVAKEKGVLFIDMNSITIAYHNEIGPEASRAFNPEAKDVTHLSDHGAKQISDLVVKEVVKVIPQLEAYFIPVTK